MTEPSTTPPSLEFLFHSHTSMELIESLSTFLSSFPELSQLQLLSSLTYSLGGLIAQTPIDDLTRGELCEVAKSYLSHVVAYWPQGGGASADHSQTPKEDSQQN